MSAVRVRLAPQWRGVLLGAGLMLALGGCARTPDWLPWHKPAEETHIQPAAPQPPVPEPRKPRPQRHTAPEPKPPVAVAMIDPAAMVGMKPPAVTQLLGAPNVTSKDEMSLVWTYAADGCALKVYFYPDLKTADFHVLKYTLADEAGKPLDDEAPCRRRLLAVRDHDAG